MPDGIENRHTSPQESKAEQRGPKKSSRRLLWAVEKQLNWLFRGGKPEVVGRENLEQLTPGMRVIFATTHTSDNDVLLAVEALGEDFDLAVTDMSIHRNLRQSAKAMDPTILGIKIAGKENFLSLKYSQRKAGRRGWIDPEDTEKIKATLEAGKSVIIAAHNPTFDGKLSANPGFATIRAAQITENAVVVPVAVQIGEPADVLGIGNPKNILETRRKRPSLKVSIGEPLRFDDPEVKKAGDFIDENVRRREAGSSLPDDARKLGAARKIIRKEGGRLMRAIASMLPPEKRGVWQEVEEIAPVDLKVEDSRGVLEEKSLPELSTEFVSVTDEMVARRTVQAEQEMTSMGLSVAQVFEYPDSDVAAEYDALIEELVDKESEIIKKYWGWDSSLSKIDGKVTVVAPGLVVFSFPYLSWANKAMQRYEFYYADQDGRITVLSIEKNADSAFEDIMAEAFADELRSQARAGVNFVPLDLSEADSFVHSMKVAKRWVGKELYGIDPHESEPI
jgi:1-acyl-sn-glycerol-3-phosphate acyltransferase